MMAARYVGYKCVQSNPVVVDWEARPSPDLEMTAFLESEESRGEYGWEIVEGRRDHPNCQYTFSDERTALMFKLRFG